MPRLHILTGVSAQICTTELFQTAYLLLPQLGSFLVF